MATIGDEIKWSNIKESQYSGNCQQCGKRYEEGSHVYGSTDSRLVAGTKRKWCMVCPDCYHNDRPVPKETSELVKGLVGAIGSDVDFGTGGKSIMSGIAGFPGVDAMADFFSLVGDLLPKSDSDESPFSEEVKAAGLERGVPPMPGVKGEAPIPEPVKQQPSWTVESLRKNAVWSI
jgi:hypothetical protein